MWRSIIAVCLAGLVQFAVEAQVTRQFSVENKKEVEKVDFSFKVNGGQYLLKAGASDENLITIYTNENLDNYSHRYSKEIKNKTCNVSLDLKSAGEVSLSRKISYNMFWGDSRAPEKIWKVFLASGKPYRLNLNYGVGIANIDLSDLAIENLKVHSGNADVRIDYDSKSCNMVEMDTFYIKVDLGSVVVNKLNLYKSKYVLAEVGFGNMSLDFSDKPRLSSNIKGSVGAGNLLITLPGKEVPVLVKVNESWLCKVRLPKDFRKAGNNTYVNASYEEAAKNMLTFDLDVSMGSIIFKTLE
jgi:hypothetical protein